MERNSSAVEFEAVIDHEGKIAVPVRVAKQWGGKKLHVRLMTSEISDALREKSVTEEEVEQIAALQLETREQVITFLMSEGSLRNRRAFRQRVSRAYARAKGTHW